MYVLGATRQELRRLTHVPPDGLAGDEAEDN